MTSVSTASPINSRRELRSMLARKSFAGMTVARTQPWKSSGVSAMK